MNKDLKSSGFYGTCMNKTLCKPLEISLFAESFVTVSTIKTGAFYAFRECGYVQVMKKQILLISSKSEV